MEFLTLHKCDVVYSHLPSLLAENQGFLVSPRGHDAKSTVFNVREEGAVMGLDGGEEIEQSPTKALVKVPSGHKQGEVPQYARNVGRVTALQQSIFILKDQRVEIRIAGNDRGVAKYMAPKYLSIPSNTIIIIINNNNTTTKKKKIEKKKKEEEYMIWIKIACTLIRY